VRCDYIYAYDDYQIHSLVEEIFNPGGAFLTGHDIGFLARSRMEEVVKGAGFELEGEWEKDEV